MCTPNEGILIDYIKSKYKIIPKNTTIRIIAKIDSNIHSLLKERKEFIAIDGIKLFPYKNKIISKGYQVFYFTSTKKEYTKKSITSIKQTWRDMKVRCYNTKNKSYKHYGARGIKVCDRWLHSFAKFKKDMGEKPGTEYSIDRIDVNKDYSPENCRWATPKEQANNKTNNHLIEHNNKIMTVSAWAKHKDINLGTLLSRLKRGWPIEKALTKTIKD